MVYPWEMCMHRIHRSLYNHITKQDLVLDVRLLIKTLNPLIPCYSTDVNIMRVNVFLMIINIVSLVTESIIM